MSDLMAAAAVSARAGVCVRTLEREVKRGNVRATRVGRRVLFARGDVDEWLDRCRAGGP